MLRLFTTAYPERDPVRRAEYAECLNRNLACGLIDEVRILAEGGVEADLPRGAKLIVRPMNSRPTYNDFFTWINEISEASDLSIVANSDIYFDRSVGVAAEALRPRECFALSRWDVHSDGTFYHHNRSDSQDAWFLRGRVEPITTITELGVPRCDNHIAHELGEAGYRMRNPSFSIRAFHLHSAPPRRYLEPEHSVSVPPPYHYVWPENLWCLPRVLWHNWRFPQTMIYYRYDFRRWSPLRPVRRARFHLGAIRRRWLRAFTEIQKE